MQPIKSRLRVLSLLLFTLMAAGVWGFMELEHFSFIDAIYFIIVTFATVGYGDVHPVSEGGKILAMALIVTGVGTFLALIANVTEMMLNRHERRQRRQKLHMVTSLFFNETGGRLLAFFVQGDPDRKALSGELKVSAAWSDLKFKAALAALGRRIPQVEIRKINLTDLRLFLKQERDLLLRMLENPSLLEKESFTELLRAVFHLVDELSHRDSLKTLPASDLDHLAGDIRRAYALLLPQWLEYMHYLKIHFPYLFSLAVRTSPLDPQASVVVK